jgi:hypothetical protein
MLRGSRFLQLCYMQKSKTNAVRGVRSKFMGRRPSTRKPMQDDIHCETIMATTCRTSTLYQYTLSHRTDLHHVVLYRSRPGTDFYTSPASADRIVGKARQRDRHVIAVELRLVIFLEALENTDRGTQELQR